MRRCPAWRHVVMQHMARLGMAFGLLGGAASSRTSRKENGSNIAPSGYPWTFSVKLRESGSFFLGLVTFWRIYFLNANNTSVILTEFIKKCMLHVFCECMFLWENDTLNKCIEFLKTASLSLCCVLYSQRQSCCRCRDGPEEWVNVFVVWGHRKWPPLPPGSPSGGRRRRVSGWLVSPWWVCCAAEILWRVCVMA